MMGALEKGGKIASSTIDAMKSQPLALALLTVNLLFLLAAGLFVHEVAAHSAEGQQRKDKLIAEMMERCLMAAPPKGDK